MEIVPTVLTGERVKLVPMEIDHIDGLFAAAQDPRIWDYMFAKVETVDDMKRIVKEALSAKEIGLEFPFTVIDRTTDQIVGSTRFLNIATAHRRLEIGWTWYHPSVWRTRVNTECKYLLLRHCFETLGAFRVEFKTDARNVRSRRAIERLGAVKEGILRKHRINQDGSNGDTVIYSIVLDEWESVKERLERFLRD